MLDANANIPKIVDNRMVISYYTFIIMNLVYFVKSNVLVKYTDGG